GESSKLRRSGHQPVRSSCDYYYTFYPKRRIWNAVPATLLSCLPNELLHVAFSEADRRVVRPRLLQARENIVVSGRDALRIDVHQAAVHLEQGDHFRAALGHHERVRFARRLPDVAPFFGDPFVLEIMPAALEHPRVYRARVTMARDHARFSDAHDVRVLAERDVELKRAECNVLRQRNPQARIRLTHRIVNHHIGTHGVRLWL